jgi:organic radical activating enzyme
VSKGIYLERLEKLKASLDAISPSFCAAKWKQVTIHLQNGLTHSCHHPSTHKIPIEEIKVNPSALHNTNFKKEQRKLMLEGKRPSECDYCWRVEDTPGEHYSDRIYKSTEPWAYKTIPDILAEPAGFNTIPTYVEVSFGNTCNFKCSYCSPEYSSKWVEDVERHGAVQVSGSKFNDISYIKSKGFMPIPAKDHNPYIDAWWQWWPELYPTLHTFRITGGEPLLNKNTFKTLDWIISNPNPELDLAINSNLVVPDNLMQEFIDKVKFIVDNKLVKRITVYTSVDTAGAHAEYIRTGLDYNKWLANVNRVIRETGAFITIMSTFNLLSFTNYKQLLSDILVIKTDPALIRTGADKSVKAPLTIDIPYLRYPEFLSALIATPAIKQKFSELTEMVTANLGHNVVHGHHLGFYKHEEQKFVRLQHLLSRDDHYSPADYARHRRSFAMYVDEMDRRNGTDFKAVFPEYIDFYNYCKTL